MDNRRSRDLVWIVESGGKLAGNRRAELHDQTWWGGSWRCSRQDGNQWVDMTSWSVRYTMFTRCSREQDSAGGLATTEAALLDQTRLSGASVAERGWWTQLESTEAADGDLTSGDGSSRPTEN